LEKTIKSLGVKFNGNEEFSKKILQIQKELFSSELHLEPIRSSSREKSEPLSSRIPPQIIAPARNFPEVGSEITRPRGDSCPTYTNSATSLQSAPSSADSKPIKKKGVFSKLAEKFKRKSSKKSLIPKSVVLHSKIRLDWNSRYLFSDGDCSQYSQANIILYRPVAIVAGWNLHLAKLESHQRECLVLVLGELEFERAMELSVIQHPYLCKLLSIIRAGRKIYFLYDFLMRQNQNFQRRRKRR